MREIESLARAVDASPEDVRRWISLYEEALMRLNEIGLLSGSARADLSRALDEELDLFKGA